MHKSLITLSLAAIVAFGVQASPSAPKGELKAVFSEDFSGLSEGSEANPSATEISADKTVDPALMHGMQWKGRGLHAAGGVLAVLNFEESDWFGTETKQGYLECPMTDVRLDEGQFEVRFKARTKARPSAKIHIEVYDPYTTNSVAATTVDITSEWATYRAELSHPGYGNHLAFVQMASEEEEWFIDDFEIVQDYYGLMPPIVHFPRNVSYSQFTGRWNPVPLATSYLVSAYSLSDDGAPAYIVKDMPTTECTATITGTVKGTDYYYTVRSVNDRYTSDAAESRRVHVPLTALDTPEPLPATDITTDGFTAHWQPTFRAMGYILSLSREHVATDDELFTIVDENFDKCPGYGADYPDYPAVFYGNLDDYTTLPGWEAPNGAYTLPGMFGLDNYWKKYETISLTSPAMNLSADNGRFSVILKVKGTVGDGVTVKCGEVEKTNKIGATRDELTFDFDNGTAETRFVITFDGDDKLFFDNIIVRQTVHAGDTVVENVATYRTDNPATDYALTSLHAKNGDVFSYTVAAWSYSLDEDGVWGPDVFSQPSRPERVAIAAEKHMAPVLKEGFSRSESTTPGGGYYAESLYFTAADHADNDGWFSNSVYEAERAVKFNAKTKTGYLLSPSLEFSKPVAEEVTVRFRAQTWKGDNIYVCVEIDGDPSTVQKVDSDASTNITDRSEAPFEITFTNVPSGSKLRFYAEKRSDKLHRFFLSDIVVLETVDNAVAALHSSAYYHKFNDLMAGNDSEVRTIDIVGHSCSEPIAIATQEKSNFSVRKADGWDDLKGGRLEISFVPVNAGTKLETLTVASGTNVEKILLGGHAKVYAPVATAPSAVTENSFTATWQKTAGMDELVVSVYTKEEKPLVSANLMFTKYIEGKSNNRALEIFNGTGATVNLKGWKLRMEANGAGGITACEYSLPDKDLENGKTFTLCNAQFGALRDIADATIGYNDGGYANITTFTGDDAIGLFDPQDKLVDLLGYESYDCNDLVSGVWGTDVTYYRRSDSYDPHPKFYVEEWIKHPMDYCDGYGTHTMDATGSVRNIVKKIAVAGDATELVVDGLKGGTTYYYAIEGHSNGLATPSSKEISVTTDGTGVEDVTVDHDAEVEYFNLQGVKIANPGTGIYIRRQGTHVTKVYID